MVWLFIAAVITIAGALGAIILVLELIDDINFVFKDKLD
jgi:hypothetical protein